ncbi:MAG TPA: hypothetical protein VD836_10405 [Solirubrobacteraceae bacterium]|nr:hypothetical protein [Solirubrobacteraceae bacterium]
MSHDREHLEGAETASAPAAPAPEVVPPGPSAAPAPAGLSMTAIARQPPAMRAAMIARLQQTGGNRAVVARIEDSALAGPEIVKGWSQEAGEKIKIDLGSASEPEKLAEIQRLLGDALPKAGSGDADTSGWAIGRVWKSFGERMWEVALANRKLFETCLQRAPDLIYFEDGWGGMRERFKNAVEGRVRDNLAANRAYVCDEMDQMGIRAPQPGMQLPQEIGDRGLREAQIAAERVAKAQDGMARTRNIPVGTKYEVYGHGPEAMTMEETAYFDPAKKPQNPGGPGNQDWDAVKKEYDKLDLFIKQAMAQSPALFALVESGGKAAGEFAGMSPEEARAKLQPLLQALIGKIDEADGLVGEDLDYREMGPVIEQLLGTPEWSGEMEKRLIKATLWKHNRDKMLRSLGLSALSALGFLFATFATGGAAVFIGAAVGVGASATQAGLSIEDYYDKAKAREARTGNAQLDIMSQESVDSAFTQAVLDSALALIDVWGGVGAIRKLGSPAIQMLRAGEAGVKASAEMALKEGLRASDAATQAVAIERAVAEIGTEGVVRAAGKAPEELARLLPEGSEAAKKLLAAGAAAKAGAPAGEGILTKLATLSKLSKDEAAKAVAEGFDKVGYIGTLEAAGGWKAVTKQFGEGHEVVTKLEAWRTGIVQEGADYIKTASKGDSSAVRTGTEQGTSDVDISTFGRDAAQNVDRIKEFMARRTNVTRDRLEFLLDADAAVNPSRMHLQDIAKNLSPTMHNQILVESARHQEQLVFARRWHDAKEAGDFVLMERLEVAAREVGIAEINKTWKAMDPGTLSALERQLDGWAKQLAKLEADGASEAARRPLIEKIGRGQAELLANNPNMYIDAGNIKTLVTRRDIDAKKIEAALGSLDAASLDRLGTVFSQERYLKILGEGPHIDHALQAIQLGKGTPVEIANALKSFAKHGERVIKTIGADVAHGIDPIAWAAMEAEFARIMKAAKSGTLIDEAATQLVGLQQRLGAEAARLEAGMTTAARALREQSQLGVALSAQQAAGISAWAAMEATTRMKIEAMKQALRDLHLGMVSGRVASDAYDVGDDPFGLGRPAPAPAPEPALP